MHLLEFVLFWNVCLFCFLMRPAFSQEGSLWHCPAPCRSQPVHFLALQQGAAEGTPKPLTLAPLDKGKVSYTPRG